jgi:hypothetical protein
MIVSRVMLAAFFAAAAATLCACGQGAGSQVPPISGSSQAFRQQGGHSWMASGKHRTLIYISDDGTNDVYAYTPKGKLVGTLTGFNSPAGECVDTAGDVFIVNSNTSQILEYAHGGTTPIATLSDPGYYPNGCAYDPTTCSSPTSTILNSTRSTPRFWSITA